MDIGQLENKLERRPHSPLFARLADEYIKIGKLTEAKELCLSGLQKYPSYSIVHIVLARCYYTEKNYPAALEEAHLALTIYPDSGVIKGLIQECLDGLNPPEPVQEPEPLPELADSEPEKLLVEDQSTPAPIGNMTDVEEAAEIASEESSDMPIEEPVGEIVPENIPALVEYDGISSGEEVPDPNPPDEESEPVGMDAIFNVQPVVEEIVKPVPAESLEKTGENVLPEPEEAAEHHADAIEEPKAPDVVPVEESVRENLQVAVPQEEAEHHPDVIEEPKAQIEEPVEESIQNVETVVEVEKPEVPPAVPSPEPREEAIEESTDGRIVSQTLAEIYVKQGVYDEAILTYKLLKQRRPEQAAEFDDRIKELEAKLQVKNEEGK
jgi:tetratricopeptide (TPR) repeat protein